MNDTKTRIIGLLVHATKILPKYAPDFTDKNVASFWLEMLVPFEFDALKEATKKLLATSKVFPSIADYMEILEVRQDPKLKAQEITTQIQSMLLPYYRPNNSELCEVGREVVRRVGGWEYLGCVNVDQVPHLARQWKELAHSILANPSYKPGQYSALPEGEVKNLIANLNANTDLNERKGRAEAAKQETNTKIAGGYQKAPCKLNWKEITQEEK